MADVSHDAARSKPWSKRRQGTLEALGLLDPEKEKLARYIASRIPSGHWARSPLLARAIGVLMGRVEGMADDFQSPILSGVAEDLTDLVKAIMSILGDNPSQASIKAFAKIDADWEKDFWEESQKRIRKAKGEKAEQMEAEKVRREFKLLTDLHAFIQESARTNSPEPAEHHHATLGEEMQTIGASLSKDALVIDTFAATKVAPCLRSLTAKLKERQAGRRR